MPSFRPTALASLTKPNQGSRQSRAKKTHKLVGFLVTYTQHRGLCATTFGRGRRPEHRRVYEERLG